MPSTTHSFVNLTDFAEKLLRIFLPAVICHRIDVYRDK
jgi:hypothetical protein